MKQPPKRFNLNDRNVPAAEINLSILNVGLRESRPSEIIDQGQQSARSGLLALAILGNPHRAM